MNNLPKQLCRLIGRTLAMLRSLSTSLTSGTMTLVFQAVGKEAVRRQPLKSRAHIRHSSGLRCSAIFHTPVDTPSWPGAVIC